jgi:hypothetical protein
MGTQKFLRDLRVPDIAAIRPLLPRPSACLIHSSGIAPDAWPVQIFAYRECRSFIPTYVGHDCAK